MTKLSIMRNISLLILFITPFCIQAQDKTTDSLLQEVTLQAAVNYALKNQPTIQRSLIDEQITEKNIKSKLADQYPQVNFNYNLQHNFIVPTNVIGGNVIKLGVNNTSSGQFTLSQAIFNKDVLLAKRTGTAVRAQAQQVTINGKIDLAAAVSKAFYDVLATRQQIKVVLQNIVRTEQNLRDAYNQYKVGVVDKVDHKRAAISLNNSKATLKSNEEILKAKLEYLKALMSYPQDDSLNIVYDSLELEKQVLLDTIQQSDYRNRIEYQILQTQRSLLKANVLYNKWSYLPTVSANGAYNFNFQNNEFTKLYSTNYPSSFAALTLSFSIFQGGKRKENLAAAELQLQKNDLDIKSLKNNVNTQYAQALALYKSNLVNYLALKDNVALAKEVYDVIQLQYRSGIKAYLEVIISETDLHTAEINYYNALYQVLASKVDVQKALGQINY